MNLSIQPCSRNSSSLLFVIAKPSGLNMAGSRFSQVRELWFPRSRFADTIAKWHEQKLEYLEPSGRNYYAQNMASSRHYSNFGVAVFGNVWSSVYFLHSCGGSGMQGS